MENIWHWTDWENIWHWTEPIKNNNQRIGLSDNSIPAPYFNEQNEEIE